MNYLYTLLFLSQHNWNRFNFFEPLRNLKYNRRDIYIPVLRNTSVILLKVYRHSIADSLMNLQILRKMTKTKMIWFGYHSELQNTLNSIESIASMEA